MHTVFTTHLQAVDDSIMLAIPPALLEQLSLRAGDMVTLSLDHQSLIVERLGKPTDSLEALMAATDFDAPMGADDAVWMSSPAVGRELI